MDANTSLSLTASILEGAIRYKLPLLVDSAKRRMMEFLESRPFELYLRAVTMRWKDAARAAAVRLTRCQLTTLYHSYLEDVPAIYYQALLRFVFDYKKALARKIASEQNSILDGSCWKGLDLNNVSGETTPESVIGFIDFCSQRSQSGSLTRGITYYSECAQRSRKVLSRVREVLSISSGIALIPGSGSARYTGSYMVIDLNDQWVCGYTAR